MLKRKGTLIVLALLLALSLSAFADSSVSVEVIRADGVSVVVLTPEETVSRARSLANGAAGEDGADLVLPEQLTLIEEGAFEGIAAKRVDVSDHVVGIEARAFADCKSLREIFIPATVLKVDDYALDGCTDVTVYGTRGTEAERFAKAARFAFIDLSEGTEYPHDPLRAPVELPLVKR